MRLKDAQFPTLEIPGASKQGSFTLTWAAD
jgi:hypothetical protein